MKWNILKSLFFICCLAFALKGFSQKKINTTLHSSKEKVRKKAHEKSKTFAGDFLNTHVTNPKKYLGIEANANTNGWCLGLFFLREKTAFNSHWLGLQLSEVRPDKQEKLKPTLYAIENYTKPLAYIYGKQNSFYCLNVDYGIKKIIYKGLISPAIDVAFTLKGGISIGALKPYYLKVNMADNTNQYIIEDISYSQNYTYFLDTKRIYSKSSFKQGWKQTKYIAGLHCNPMLQINLNAKQVWLKSIQLGANLNVYSAKLPLMIDNKAHFYTVAWTMGLLVGKGW
jgi:hypothetical protein